ncbi:ubiquitin recognition factor in ER-associated degradation protein 1-like [Homarus americanus]|uniref:Ubiquitin fusion degradation protein 1 homolog n=1 Tax=Homarus americanus TaxID=6706 RepID=A0A8J5JQA4_HOMAM|nr:ubiquitin recognition factor in ER-associated degradation protein 1-like [Homarus americanus]XP_042238739.1 ubiquitin recognition factor in ER-associated degradation protein 1-like [Homarus americanus]XP_042238740.1 ubiquitin recognition factor in ER-associated degradation protein 1-like [Homarus americanus]KAG7159670.1 Ubiquitin recognition factor in ER-associated degradation protein 1-like [Homarus americanus]
MFSFNMFGEPLQPRPFNTHYRCYSVSMFPGDKQAVENGGKIIMPPSALDVLTRLNIVYPMLFKLTNQRANRHTHCGVLEFVADEGKVYIPYWMMRNLLLDEGDLVHIESQSLPVATFSKFEPQSVEFLDITNPKAVLENALRNFACLTLDDVIALNYNDRIYEMRVLEVKPGNAVSIIECDMNVEFAAPVGYQEPERMDSAAALPEDDKEEMLHEPTGFYSFQGSGNRLDGKKKNLQLPQEELLKRHPRQRGIPDYDYEVGLIKFWRKVPKVAETETKVEEQEEFESFQGKGTSLRQAKTRK